ncbi:AMP-binding protein [Streptomyces zhihengii]
MIGSLMHSSLLRRGDGPAVTGADGRSLDGATLHAAAARLAAALRAQGAGPGHTVAIALPQNVEQVVALAAVVYSGADFALIDLDAPPARAARFLDVLRPRCLVLDTDAPGGHQEELARTAAAVVPVRTAYGPGAGDIPFEPSFTPGGYCVQTSGTTGEPKVLRVDGAALENRLRWGQGAYPLGPDDVLLSTSRPSFDFYVWEVTAALCFGPRLVLTTAFEAASAETLLGRCEDEGATAVHFFPRMLDEFSELAASSGGCPGLRRVFSGGAPLPGATLAKARAALPNATVLNQYGPAECCIDVSWLVCGEEHEGFATVPVGRPVDRTTLTVVDSALRPVPTGVVGEILIGGIAARTTRVLAGEVPGRFVPTDVTAGEVAYRSGDFGRFDEDGLLHWVGRQDNEFKIHGGRVDLAEVTAAVRGVGGVTDCHVYPTGAADGGIALGAVVESREVTAAACRSRLAAVLPLYMVPTVLRVVERLPRTAKLEIDVPRLTEECGLRPLPPRQPPAPAGAAGTPAARGAGWAAVRPVSLPEERLIGMRRIPGRPPHLMVANHLVIRGALDLPRLTTALRELVARHSILRTTYAELDGRVVAVVHEGPADDVVEVRPLNGVLDDRAAAEHVQRALKDEEKRFSDPDRQSMMRAVVYRRAPELFSLLLIFDHIAVDERSKAMLQEELALLYQGDGHKLGPAVPYDPARIRGDFPPAREVPVLLAALDPLPPRVLPSPDPVADPAAFRAGSHEFDLLGDRRHEIDALVRRLRCTRFELLLASFFRAMKQFADEDDILVVAPADTRGTVEDFETVGFFQNLVPLRSRTPADADPWRLVDDCKQAVRAALGHRDHPVALLTEEFRDPAVTAARRNPIWQIVFVPTAMQVDANWALEGLEVADVPLRLTETGLELMAEVSDTAAGLKAAFRYARGAMEAHDAERLAVLWTRSLEWALDEVAATAAG